MLARRACLVVIGATLLGFSNCGGDDHSLVGTWSGAFRDSRGGLGGGSLIFSQQSGGSLQGSWRVFFQLTGLSSNFNNQGSLTGTLDGNSIAAVLTSQGPCPFSLQATRTGRQMSGTYVAVNCASPETGSFDLEKQ